MATVLRQQLRPDRYVLVLDLRQPEVQGLFVTVRFRRREDAVQKRRIGLVLPMMFEGEEIGGSLGSHALKTTRAGQ